jgi:hypothetical protein
MLSPSEAAFVGYLISVGTIFIGYLISGVAAINRTARNSVVVASLFLGVFRDVPRLRTPKRLLLL